MDQKTRRWIFIGGGLALAACLCLAVFGIGGAGFLFALRQSIPRTAAVRFATPLITRETPAAEGAPLPLTPSPTTESEATRETEPRVTLGITPAPESTPRATATAPKGMALPPEIERQMDEIQEQVVELRGLRPAGEVDRALLTPDQLRQYVIDDFLKDYTEQEAREDAIVLASFGLLEADFDLYDFYLELYSEQIAGFYDDETKRMYVIQDEGFKGPQRLTYAHEYVHALQDQTYDMEEGLGYSDEACEEDSERCAAIQALIEGDASLLELEWLTTYATSQDIAEIQQFYEDYTSPVYDRAPAFMQEDFLFPYITGQAYVEYLHDQGGWQAVDQAYRDLPLSTEQILHPERYPQDDPQAIPLPDLTDALGEGWQEIDRGVVGEWYTYLILAHGLEPGARVRDAQAKIAAEGWGGDAYAVYTHAQSGQVVMATRFRWEASQEASEFAQAFQEYAGERFGASGEVGDWSSWDNAAGVTRFRQDGDETTWILAPDAATATAIQQALQAP